MVDLKLNRLRPLFMLLVLGCLGASLAKADTLPPGPVTLLEHTQLVGGSFSAALDFLVPASGTVSVVLTDLGWPNSLDSLHFAAANATSTFNSLSAPGALTFDVNTPGHYFAIICGEAQGALDLGLYSVKLQWNALAASAPVPLPAAGWLLISGAAGLFGWARRRKEAMV